MSDNYFAASEFIRVPSGNYYFKIYKSGSTFSNEDYEFLVRYNSNSYGNYEIENNNEAKNSTEIIANTEFFGNLNSKSDVDFYNLSVWNADKLTIKMNIADGAAYNVTLYKEVDGELKKVRMSNYE